VGIPWGYTHPQAPTVHLHNTRTAHAHQLACLPSLQTGSFEQTGDLGLPAVSMTKSIASTASGAQMSLFPFFDMELEAEQVGAPSAGRHRI
jgi:hypothetical protein